ncbi:MAG: hypothetical protein ACLVJH_14815 [Faecalibacterium prausnitzii]
MFTAILLVCAGICLSQMRQAGGCRAADCRASHRSHQVCPPYTTYLLSPTSPSRSSWICPAPSTGWNWTPPGFRSGWPVSRTRPSPPTATLGTPCTAPTAPKRRVYTLRQKNQAYLLNESMDAAWSLLSSVPAPPALHRPPEIRAA